MKKALICFMCALLACSIVACKRKNPLIVSNNSELKYRIGISNLYSCNTFFEKPQAEREKDKHTQKLCDKWASDMFPIYQKLNIMDKSATLEDFKDSEFWKSLKDK